MKEIPMTSREEKRMLSDVLDGAPQPLKDYTINNMIKHIYNNTIYIKIFL